MTLEDIEEKFPPIDTTNEFALGAGSNLPNHSETIKGRGKYVKVCTPAYVLFRTRQSAYRFAAWLIVLADTLPHEPGEHDFLAVLEAVQDS